MPCFLGIDTSNYTTSISIVDQNGNIIEDLRRLLKVKEGERGLRQQEALFQHLKNLPELFEELKCDTNDIRAVGVSTSPEMKNREGEVLRKTLPVSLIIALLIGIAAWLMSY